MNAQMHHDQIAAQITCKACPTVFIPRRPWQAYCSVQCRSNYHQAHGHEGTVKAVRRLKHGWSIVIHAPEDAGLELGTVVQLVRR